MDTNHLIIHLPFDNSTTEDLCGNTWTVHGSPTIGTNGAINGNALQLDGASCIQRNGIITLGGKDFTISGWFTMNSSTTGWGTLFEATTSKGTPQRVEITRYNAADTLRIYANEMWGFYQDVNIPVNTHFHLELDYQHSASKLRIFVDGVLAATVNKSLTAKNFIAITLGQGTSDKYYWKGTIDEFQIYDGVALHTENFTPPTDDDYTQQRIDLLGYADIALDLDTERVLANASLKPIHHYLSFAGTSSSYGLLPLSVLPGATTFTIEVKFSTTSTANYTNNYDWKTIIGREIQDYWKNDFGLCVNGGKLAFWAEPSTRNSSISQARGITSTATVNDGEIHKAAVVSSGGTIYLYCDDKLVATTSGVNAKITDSYRIAIAGNVNNSNGWLKMDLYEARFWSVARSQAQIFADIDGTESGLEAWYIPTDSTSIIPDLSGNNRDATLYGSPAYTVIYELDIALDLDTERKITNAALTWRYENPGNADDLIVSSTILTDLPETKSITGTAFYQTQRVKCFDLAATPEVWMKFDVYFDGSNRWRAFNGAGNDYAYNAGVTAQTAGYLSLVQNSAVIQNAAGICKTNQLQTVLLHMISGSTAGVIEAWVDGVKIYTYTGDVNHGSDFADLYLQSDGSGTFFSNVIISNAEIEFGEGWHNLYPDFERKIANRVEVIADVKRELIIPIIVPFIGEHFNHFIASLILVNGKSEKIVLPKKSNVYVRAVGTGVINVYTDINAAGKTTGIDYFAPSNFYAEFDECNSVFIEISPIFTPQQVIKSFMASLKRYSSKSYGLNSAISECSNGKFANITALKNTFMRDLNISASYTDFLSDYCEIILDNADTGAITGLDAGGGVEKTAESVVPEKTSPANWTMPTAGSTSTIYGLTVYWPRRGASGTFTDAEKFILAGLNSEWIARSLELIQDTFAMGFDSEGVTIKSIDVNFQRSNDNVLAYVMRQLDSSNNVTKISLYVNMWYYEQIDTDSADGDSFAFGAIYLDRTLAHEFVHAVMAVNLNALMERLPLYIREGTAELVHGIDDERRNTIEELLTTRTSDLENVFSNGDGDGDDAYAAGYLILRYLAKQGTRTITAEDNSNASGLEITNLLISDGDTDSSYEALTDNTRQFLYPDIARTFINAYDIFFDVALLSTVPVELFADLRRTIITKLSLFPTNNTDYFSGGGSTAITLPSQEVIPSAAGNTSGLQSIEITLAEQQLTDQVTVTGIIPFDIMGGVSGTYLDYDYDMCVEGVTQQGALYTADCCSGVDELLYTQINYSLSSGFTYFAPDYEEMTLSIINTPSDGDEVPEGTIRKGKASTHLKQIADALDKDCVCQFEDFISEINERQEDVTYNDIISQLFGWTSRLPQRMINVFIRDDTLFAVQRGQEKKTLDITGANYPYPTIEKKLMRTMWGSGKFGITPQTKEETEDTRQLIGGIRVSPWPPTTSADGKTKYIYHDVTGYAGVDGNGYALQQTETKNNDGGRTIVTYIYSIVNGIYTCVAEESKTYDGEGKKVDEHKIIHDRLTRSQEFSRMEDEDGNTLASNVSSNLPGFYNESYVLQKPYEIGSEKTYQMISGYNRLVDSNFPVCDPDIYPKLIEAYAWLNRKTQETVNLDIYNYPHLIDFNDKIVLNGKEYFLVSNTAITTPHIFNRQSISIVRWY